MALWYGAAMTACNTPRHSGTYQYWKPQRFTWERWSTLAWFIALGLSLATVVWCIIAMAALVLTEIGSR